MPYYRPDTFRYQHFAPDRGFLAMSMSPEAAAGTTTMPTAGRLEFIKVKVPTPSSVTNIVMYCQTAGSTLTAGQCFAVLYTGAGARVGVTADQSGTWNSSGIKTMALASGPFACAAGDYYIAFWFNGTTGPTWTRGASAGGATFENIGTSAPTLIVGSADTGLTTTSPATMGAQTAQAFPWWAALS